MNNGSVPKIRRTIAARPVPVPTASARTLSALRMATGPGYMAGGVNERMLKAAARR